MAVGGRRRSTRLLVPCAIVVVVALALIPFLTRAGGAPRVTAGVSVLGRDLSNLTADEVAGVLQNAFQAYSHRPFNLRADAVLLAVSPSDLGVGLDVAGSVQKILAVGDQEGLLDRAGQLLGRPSKREATLVLTIPEDGVGATVSRLAAMVDRPARDAQLFIIPAGVTLPPSQAGRRVDTALTAQRLRAHLLAMAADDLEAVVGDVAPSLREQDWEQAATAARRMLDAPIQLRYGERTWRLAAPDLARLLIAVPPVAGRGAQVRWDEAALATYLSTITKEVEVRATDARVEWRNGRFTVVGGVQGTKVDASTSAARLEAAAEGDHVATLATVAVPPAVAASSWQEAAAIANQATKTPLKLAFRDRSWTISAEDLAAMLTFTEVGGGASHYAVTLNNESVAGFLKAVAKDIDRSLRDARFRLQDGKVALLADGEEGLAVDIPNTVAAVARHVFGDQRTVPLAVVVTKPHVVSADAAQIALPDIIMEASTSYAGSIPERAHNVELAANNLNGTLVPPDGVFSFNQSVGPTTLASGYEIAYGITLQGDQAVTVPAEAGGICQVATTIFHAAFWAGLPIVQRQGHIYWISRYGEPPRGMVGLDATVDDPYLDFKFRNTTGSWLLVEATTDGASLRFALRGHKPAWDVKVDPSVITGVVKTSQEAVRQDDPTMPKGHEIWVEHAEDGFTARVRRTVTQEGRIVDTTEIVSSYRPARNVLFVGTKEVVPTPTSIPVATQSAPATATPRATPVGTAIPTQTKNPTPKPR